MMSNENISFEDILMSAAKRNFWAFCCYMDYDFFKNKRPFLYKVAFAFQQIIDNYRNGIAITVKVSMPPRAGKSYITSLFAVYWLAMFPELSVMRNSCTGRLYDKFSYDTRAILRTERFKALFPHIQLSDDKQNLAGWNLKTSKQVAYFGAGVGGTIIGFGANIAISDDLYKDMRDALSQTTGDNVKQWKESAHDSRMEKNCPEIFIGTRWTKNDIIGSTTCNYEVIISALTDKGETFCDDVKSTAEYLKIRDNIDKSVWLAEYMQDPMEVEGLLLALVNLNFDNMQLAKESMHENIIFRFAVVDPADKGGDNYAVLFCWAMFIDEKLRVYVHDVIYNKMGTEVNSNRIIERCNIHHTETIFVESNGVGLASVIQIKNNLPSTCKLSAFASSINKEVRILSHYEFVARSFVFDMNFAMNNEYNMYINNLTSYVKEGDNKHIADAIDVSCVAANIIKIKYKSLIYS